MARATPDYRPSQKDQAAIAEVRDCITEGKRWHNDFARKVERRYSAWRGLQDVDYKPKGWRSNQHPPYLINIIEGMLSSLEEENPVWEVEPRAVPGMGIEDALAAVDGAELSGHLLNHQMRVDEFALKTGPLAHQDLIAGFTVGKVYWLKKNMRRFSLDEVPELIYDEAGGSIDIANKLDEFEENIVLRDDPTLEVRDVRDFLYPESATSIDASPWLIDRTYVTYDTLERMEALGIYKNVKYVQETRMDEDNAASDVVKSRERLLRRVNRTRGLVEIVELWTEKKVVTVANGSVLLRNEPNPFWHGRKPFVTACAIPDLFQIPGVSIIEGLASMQEMLWTLTNLRLDATRIASNVITMIRGDVDNPSQYEWAPEAQWIVPDPNAVKVMDMGPVAAAAASTLQAEGLLRGDIQNIMGGLPFTGGAQSQTLPVDTATGMSIITNIAQAILARRKAQYQRAFGRIGQMFLELDQQFMRDEARLVPILGEGGAKRFIEVGWRDVQGIYDVKLNVSGESLMRQEKRAENSSLTTMVMQSAPMAAQFGVKLNVRRFWERLLRDGYGIQDVESYFTEDAPVGAAGPGPPPPGGGGGNAPGTPAGSSSILDAMTQGSIPAGGITNESLAAGPTAPSSPVTMSPSAPMQQALARTGAGRSA